MPRTVVASICTLLLVSTLNLPATAAEPSPDLFGLASLDIVSDVAAFAQQAGGAPAFAQIFWRPEDGWPNTWAAPMLSSLHSLGSTPYVEITTVNEAEAFASFLAGGQDAAFLAMVDIIAGWLRADPSHKILIAPFPEANLAEFVWNDPADFRAGYDKVRDAFLAEGLLPDQIRFVWSHNGGMPTGVEYADYYPGDAFVDVIGFSKINRNSPWRDYQDTMGVYIQEIQEELTRVKPILVAQTGSVEEGQDRDGWLADMFSNIAAEEQVIGAIYFNRDKFEAGKQNDYRILVDGVLAPAVVTGLESWSMSTEVSWIFDGRMDAWVAERAEEIAGNGFVDTVDSVFADDITWLAAEGITSGCNPPTNDRFCPDDPVTRGQMAAFLVRAMGYTDAGLIDFTDDDNSVFEADIEKLAAAEVTLGCNPPTNDRFCPDDLVTREQMAAFLHRALVDTLIPGEPVEFSDDDASVFESDIEWLGATGVTTGCGGTAFCPDDVVTRGQMAAFLHRALRA